MEILNSLSKMLWPKKNNIILGIFALIALCGFLDATYLTLEHFRGSIPPCTLASGCETVLTSPYAVIGPVPVALLGACYYVAILFGAILVYQTKNEKLLIWLARATALGFLASLYFFSLQAFVIGAWCQYCIASIVTSTLLFATGVYTLSRQRTV